MALADEVKGRLGTTGRLVELTNPNSPSATTIDDTRLAYACADAAALLEIEAGVEFDITNDLHVAVVVEGVIYVLHKRAGQQTQAFKDAEDSWNRWLGKLAEVTGRDRVSPITSSNLVPSREGGTSPLPDFDRDQMRGLQLRPPRGHEHDSEED